MLAYCDEAKRYNDVTVEAGIQERFNDCRILTKRERERQIGKTFVLDAYYSHLPTTRGPSLNTKLPGPKASLALLPTSLALLPRSVRPSDEMATYWP